MEKSKKYPGVMIYRPANTDDEVYYIKYRDPAGRQIKERVGRRSERYTQEIAAKVRAERIQALRHGAVLPRSTGMTFQEAFDRWADDQRNKGVVGVDRLVGIYRKHAAGVLAPMRLQDITAEVVNRLSRAMADAGSRPGTIRIVHHIIRATWKHAVSYGGFRGRNPMDGVARPKGASRRERYLTREEAQRLLDGMRAMAGEDYWMFTAIGLCTGMRRSEILGIRGRDIDYQSGTIAVVGKGRKVRHCEVPPELMAKVRERNPGPNDPLIPKFSDFVFRTTVDRLGFNTGVTRGDRINSVSAHTLRHTYGSWLAADGTPITVIKELMGHADISTTMRYLKVAPRAGATYVARMAAGIRL